jgi:membrane associated rhomboid family serine protease
LNKQIPKEFWIVTSVFISMLAALAIAVAFGGLSPLVFAVLVALSMVFPFLRYWSLFKAAAKDQQQSDTVKTIDVLSQARSTIRSAKVRIGVLIALTCLALWETRSGPLVPCLIGLGMLLLLLTGNILSLLQARRRLEQLNSGE